ncbi:DER1-domain-containing protein [Irpex rosettiformis]|uniref:DER1-domain-containing protein n=1 Tax=Irpex rosettiformis TaxID=378272 RepID=A0ACB8U3T3_9APHY|nr:DER1-domain-containing protein [Irpex rosettiformis]
MSALASEIKKIPPVTRFLIGSSLGITVSAILQLVSPYRLFYVTELVFKKFELWRLYTSFFYGGGGFQYIFDFVMLYQNSNAVESSHFMARSADYAWQLIFANAFIVALNIPLKSAIFTRPLLVCIIYLHSRLSPPGAQTSFYGILTLPLTYYPFIIIFIDLVVGGPHAAAMSVTGAIAGHAWWWGVYDTRVLAEFAKPPRWLQQLVDGEPDAGSASGGAGGVHVVPPRDRIPVRDSVLGHKWGSGNRLGSG